MSDQRYQCPACHTNTDEKAFVCYHPSCKASLAFCPYCRTITTYNPVEEKSNRFLRNTYRCDRCQGLSVKCLTWLMGGYCNGLARPGKRLGRIFCPTCATKASDAGRSIISWSIIGLLGGFLRRGK